MINVTSNTAIFLSFFLSFIRFVGRLFMSYLGWPQAERAHVVPLEKNRYFLQKLLDSLIKKSHLQAAINEHEEAYNFLLERQLESGVFELDEENSLNANADLQELYEQLAQIDGVSFDLDEANTIDANTLNDIAEQTKILNNLVEKNDEIRLLSIDIQARQEIQISQKTIDVQQLKKQMELTRRADTFFGRDNFSERDFIDSFNEQQRLHS